MSSGQVRRALPANPGRSHFPRWRPLTSLLGPGYMKRRSDKHSHFQGPNIFCGVRVTGKGQKDSHASQGPLYTYTLRFTSFSKLLVMHAFYVCVCWRVRGMMVESPMCRGWGGRGAHALCFTLVSSSLGTSHTVGDISCSSILYWVCLLENV